MCNLYAARKSRDEVRGLFKVSDNRAAAFQPSSAIFPRHVAPVVRATPDGDREIVTMTWGFLLLQDGRAPRPVTNVRDDKLRTSGFWAESFQRRRCLVPATSFCEPNGDVKPATWHWFALKGDDPRPLFAFPGVWRRYRGPAKKDGPNVDIQTYAFLTTTPNPLVGAINHERMPVLLSREDDFETWLNGPEDAAAALVREYPAQHMQMVQEGYDKEDLLAVA
jgi:putative SOS response-associated peptidase YedK